MDFLILPDREDAAALPGAAGGPPDRRTVTHASGRPWVSGRWRDDEAVLVTAGTRRLLLFGTVRVRTGDLERALAAASGLHDLDSVARGIAGCFHLAASFDGRIRVQGSVSTARQVFRADIAGVTAAASDQGTLAALTGRGTQDDAVALRLLSPIASWPLNQRTLWSGVTALPFGSWLEVREDGGRATHRWWHPPEPDTPLERGVPAVRDALRDAVAARARGRTISADLSGGMDSTSLCFLAAATGTDLITHHWRPLDPANDDAVWARRAAGHLPGVRHRSMATDSRPAWFHESPDGPPPHGGPGAGGVEGPLPWHRNRAQMEHLAAAVAADASEAHLMGVGGDELFSPTPTHLWTLVRSRPLPGLRAVNRARMLNRWGLRATVRGLADRGTFASSLLGTADGLTLPPLPPAVPPMGWGGSIRMPPWATPEAVGAVRRLIRETAAEHPEPLHPARSQHQVLEAAVISGGALRQMNLALSRFGVPWEAPFLDDRVLEAALRVRIEDRAAPGLYKPVLAAALRGVVPDVFLGRRSKGEFSAEVYEGLERGRHRLTQWCDDLRLAGLGLVDADALRTALLSPKPESRHLAPFETTVACESWLRSVGADASGAEILAGEPR